MSDNCCPYAGALRSFVGSATDDCDCYCHDWDYDGEEDDE